MGYARFICGIVNFLVPVGILVQENRKKEGKKMVMFLVGVILLLIGSLMQSEEKRNKEKSLGMYE